MLKNIFGVAPFVLLFAACSGGGKTNDIAPATLQASADQSSSAPSSVPASPSDTAPVSDSAFTSNPASPNSGTLSISAATFSFSQDCGTATVTVNRAGGSIGAASVHFATQDGSATAASDYSSTNGQLTWSDGDVSAKTIAISISNVAPFTGNKTFNVNLSSNLGAALGAQNATIITITGSAFASATIPFDHHIVVDQFGYRPSDQKVAIVRTPQLGYDAGDTFSPGATYQLRRASDGTSVFSAAIAQWNGGATQTSSGDRGWWFDFSGVSTAGKYFVYDVARNVRSATFDIDPNVYKKILKTATRMFFYQRNGFAKRTPYAEACWTDEAAYLGPNQDSQAHDVTDKANANKVRDLSGGWFDAGDTNKYVTFAISPVHQLLMAYQNSPGVFTDDFNIPESGNGIPDVIDELKWETDWLKKMQNADGSAALKVGALIYTSASPPSSDTSSRYYIPTCTSSTIALSGMLAHASYVYNSISALSAEAAELKTRAINAWNNYQSIPTKQTSCDTGEVKAGIADLSAADQNAQAVVAAIYLFAITGNSVYNDYVKANYHATRPYNDFGWTRYNPEQGEALLFYTTLSNADATLKTTLLNDKRNDMSANNQVYGFAANDDLYRNFMHDAQYHWGSNQVRANYGNSNDDAIVYSLAGANAANYQTRALEVLHYFHGANPLGMVYLTNMKSQGATVSANEIYHLWYASGSKWSDASTSVCGPAPGYVPGGPNANAANDGVPSMLAPPIGQPLQKSYKDWNVGYNATLGMNESAWAITEPGIYYQAAYIKLLAMFAQ